MRQLLLSLSISRFISFVNSIVSFVQITTVQAYDRDSGPRGQIGYSIRKAPPDMPIVIDASTGVLTTTKKIDREEAASYSFTVVATDKGKPPLVRDCDGGMFCNCKG